MNHYIQINDDGTVFSDSWLSGEVHAPNMIKVGDDFDPTNKKYVNGEWIDYVPEVTTIPEVSTEPTQLDIIEANTSYLVMMMEG